MHRVFLSPGGKPLRKPYFERAVLRAFETARVSLEKRKKKAFELSFARLDPRAEPAPKPPVVVPATPIVVSTASASPRRARVRAFVDEIKRRAKGCKDCGALREQPTLLTFDHLPGFAKRFNLGDAGRHSVAAVRAEIAKCELVCVPCHRARERARGR
jgi:hypothetical protein